MQSHHRNRSADTVGSGAGAPADRGGAERGRFESGAKRWLIRWRLATIGGRGPEARTLSVDRTEAVELMNRYCAGEVAAFHRLYTLVSPPLVAYLRRLLGDRASAEDVLQLTFLKVHQARSKYVRDADPIPWIYTIAHRTYLDEIRKRRRSVDRIAAYGQQPPQPAADLTGTAQQELANQEPPDAVVTALRLLPDTQRQALLLTTFQGRSHTEAAAIMGTTPGAIKLRVHRAYVTLRQVLRQTKHADTTARRNWRHEVEFRVSELTRRLRE